MIRLEEWVMVRNLRRNSLTITEISQRLGLDRKTVRRAILSSKPPAYTRRRPSKLDPYKQYIISRLEEGVTNAVKLLREIKQLGYKGQISILRDFLGPLKQERSRQAWMRFETMPGEQSQVDWGYFGTIDHYGERKRLYCFTMVLGYSRCLYIEFTIGMDIRTLMRCHIHAFEYFGGHTKTILYDRMKQIVLYRDEDGRVRFNPQFLDFSDYYGFEPKVCRPNRAQTKGKVERSIGYVRQNFFQGEKFKDLWILNARARWWLDNVANQRVHGTTGEVPFERLKRENLIPIEKPPYDTSYIEPRMVTKDCFISYQGNRYSVPYFFVRRSVLLKDNGDGWLRIYYKGNLIATHRIVRGRGKSVHNLKHTEGIQGKERRARINPSNPIHIGEILDEIFPFSANKSEFPEVEHRPLSVYEDEGREL